MALIWMFRFEKGSRYINIEITRRNYDSIMRKGNFRALKRTEEKITKTIIVAKWEVEQLF